MASEAAALLDELMGQQRNALPGEKVRETRWSDPEVCRHFLCGFCPSELFTNTKSDIGPCDKLHDERLKNMYQESERCGKLGYEDEFLHYLEKLVRDLDRRIERGRERLQKSVSAKQKVLQGETGINSDKLKTLNDEINMKVAELDTLGTRGLVEEAQQLMKRVEDLERERERERMHLVNMTHKRLGGFDLDAHDFHEKMELCDVCGSFLVIGDVQLRVDAHLLGKQHLGFARIRATIAELKKTKEDKIKRRHGEFEDRDGRSRDRDSKEAVDKGSGEKEVKMNKDEEKEIVTKGKTWRVSRDSRSSRSRSRERDHGRQLPRSREQRPRSPDKERIGRSRSREREGNNRRRSRSHSRGREQPGRRYRRSASREKEKRDERQRSRSRSRERRKEEPRERAKDREGKEKSKEERSREERPREERLREEKPREERSREDRREGKDKVREERRDRDRSGRPREREERDKPKDKDREESR